MARCCYSYMLVIAPTQMMGYNHSSMVRELISNSIPDKTVDVVIYPCPAFIYFALANCESRNELWFCSHPCYIAFRILSHLCLNWRLQKRVHNSKDGDRSNLTSCFKVIHQWASSTGLTAVSKFKPRLPAQWAVGTHRKGSSRMEKVTSRVNWPIRHSTQIRK